MPKFSRKNLEVIITIKPCPPHDIDCQPLLLPPPPPPTPPHNHHLPPLVVVLLCIFAASVSFLSYIAIVKACRAFRKRSRARTNGSINPIETHQDFVDQERGSVVFHPIWLINTIGLDQSVIDSIGFFKYEKGNGFVVDGCDSDCAVCLGEFRDGESVRILPKCNHAFHVACIDMWLRSHKNCPVCRALVIGHTVTNAEIEPNPIESNAQEENPIGELGNETENNQEIDRNSDGLVKVRVQSDLMDHRGRDRQEPETIRRSVSMVQLEGVNNGDRESKKVNVLEKNRKCGKNGSFGNRGEVKSQSL